MSTDTTCYLRQHPACRNPALALLRHARAMGHDVAPLRAAIAFAAHGHTGQSRLNGFPFLVHPLAVALAAQSLGATPVQVTTAVLHDVIEDSHRISGDALRTAFGKAVTRQVLALTKDVLLPKPARVTEAHGRLLQAVAAGEPGLALVKLLDRAHNAATSSPLSAEKLQCMQRENFCLFAPLAHWIGADGLAGFLLAEPPIWWRSEHDFPAQMQRLQAPFAW